MYEHGYRPSWPCMDLTKSRQDRSCELGYKIGMIVPSMHGPVFLFGHRGIIRDSARLHCLDFDKKSYIGSIDDICSYTIPRLFTGGLI